MPAAYQPTKLLSNADVLYLYIIYLSIRDLKFAHLQRVYPCDAMFIERYIVDGGEAETYVVERISLSALLVASSRKVFSRQLFKRL